MKKIDKIELLAPAGNAERLQAAFRFGADAVYLAAKKYSLRAFSDNFNNDELRAAINFAHSLGKKVYVALNIFAFDEDLQGLGELAAELAEMKADAVIVADMGVFGTVKRFAPKLPIHVSTQNNITNSAAARMWADMGAERLVLAREMNLIQIRQIRDALPDNVAIEAFVHGAMCMSYSGRCLLSNYLAARPSNRGECAQSCRWEYTVTERSRKGQELEIQEDGRGTYILNSKDMCMIEHIDKLCDAGIESFKIEGRIKTAYYVANTVNAYRRAIDLYYKDRENFTLPFELLNELNKSSRRSYCTGFYFNDTNNVSLDSSKPDNGSLFCAVVLSAGAGWIKVEQRNRFKCGDTLEILSPNSVFNTKILITEMTDLNGNLVTDAFLVQQILLIATNINGIEAGDILRN